MVHLFNISKIYNNLTFVFRGAYSIVFITLFLHAITFAGQGYDLDEFDDLELESLNKKKNVRSNSSNKKQLILFDDNLYLLDDNFDFGADELELQKLELDPDEMETAKEYEDFLNAFFENTTPVGGSNYNNSNYMPQETSRGYKDKSNKRSKSSVKNSKVKIPPKKSKNTSQPDQTIRPSRGTMGFGVSTIMGATIPITMEGFSTGSNFGIRINTPISFNLAGMEANLGTDIYFSSFSNNDENLAAADNNKFKITNFIGNISIFPLSKIEIRTGIGFTPLAIGDYSVTALSIPIDVNYYLPINFAGFRFAINMHAQRAMGYPSDEGVELGDATDFIYLGLLIDTPLAF